MGLKRRPSVADTFIPPELGSTPASTTPAFTDEVEQEEPVMDDHGGEETDEVETGEHSEQPIPPAFTDVVETDGQPAITIFTTPVSPDEGEQGEQDEGEFVGEVEGQPVDEHSGEEEPPQPIPHE